MFVYNMQMQVFYIIKLQMLLYYSNATVLRICNIILMQMFPYVIPCKYICVVFIRVFL